MQKPTHHILVCNSFRASGEPRGVCAKQGTVSLVQYLEEEINDRGIDAQVSMCGCLKVCDRGPAMVIYPRNYWYGGMTEEKIDEVLDALENGEAAEEYLMS
jgi:(2Fe-2S) ferredoxin